MAGPLRSSRLCEFGFAHGFTLRSEIADSDGDGVAGAASRDGVRRGRAAAAGLGNVLLYEVAQVHGAEVRLVCRGDDPLLVRAEQADALAAGEPSLAVGVRVADCLPLLLADTGTGAVAAVHAGWRGAAAGVVKAGLDALLSLGGGSAERVVAAVFPHLRPCCFEVGEEVAARLQAVCAGAQVVDRGRDRPHLDLAAVVRFQLGSCGVTEDRIDDVAGCTRCGGDRFHSYRREGLTAGRHLAAIAVRG